MSKDERLKKEDIYKTTFQVVREDEYKQMEQRLEGRWGKRGSILNLGKPMSEMNYHKAKKIESAKEQTELLYAWYLQCEDKRTRVIGKAWFQETKGLFDEMKYNDLFRDFFSDEEREKNIDTEKIYKQRFFQYEKAVEIMKQITEGRPSQYILTNPVFATEWELEKYYGERTTARLTEYHVLYAEVDPYNPKKALPKYNHLSARQVAHLIKKKLASVGFPQPTEITYSRGPQLWWKIGPIPAFMMEEWKMMMKYLNELLAEFGADTNALDGVRILRAIGSIHEKTGQVITGETFSEDRLDFMELFQQFCWNDWLLYLEEKEKKRKEKIEKIEEEYNLKRKWMLEQGIIDSKGNYTEKYEPNKRKRRVNKEAVKHVWNTRHQNVINGVFHLCNLRNGYMDGYREFSCYIVYLMALRIHGGVELKALKEVYDLYESFAIQKYEWDDLVGRIRSAEDDYKRWELNEDDGYNYKTTTLIEKFQITPEEMKRMRYIVDAERALEIHMEADRNYQKQKYLKTLEEQGKMTKKEQKAYQVQVLFDYLDEHGETTNKALYELFGEKFGIKMRTLEDRAKEARARFK